MIVFGVERPRVNWGSVFVQTLREPAVLECFGLFFLVLSEEEARARSPGAGEIRGESLDGAGAHRRHPAKQSRYY